MDLYREYNRLRKNLLQSARYHNIPVVGLPTARNLGHNVTISDIKQIQTKRESLKIISKTTSKYSTPKVTIGSIPKSKPKSTKTSKPKSIKTTKTKKEKAPKSYANIYKKFGSRYVAVSGSHIVDTQTGTEIASTLDPNADEVVGLYLHSTYGKDKYKKSEAKNVYEFELFKIQLQNRIDLAFEDYNSRDYKRRGASLEALETLQTLVNKMNNEDLGKAYLRYKKYSSEIKNYLDDALYYTTSDSHARALMIVTELLDNDDFSKSANKIIAELEADYTLVYNDEGKFLGE